MGFNKIPRGEYPRPEAKRHEWTCLNGKWYFAFDKENIGMKNKWYEKKEFDQQIVVPYVYQSKLSGINVKDTIENVWYTRPFKIDSKHEEMNVLLNFGAVDHECIVFIDGQFVGNHEGGVTPFCFNITPFIEDSIEDEHYLTVKVRDPPFDNEIPRGKQTTEKQMSGARYERCTGIWQSTWLEFMNGESWLDRNDCSIVPDIASGKIKASIRISGKIEDYLVVEASVIDSKGNEISEVSFQMLADFINQKSRVASLNLFIEPGMIKPWTPSSPNLYKIRFKLINGDSDDESDEIIDILECTFGFRNINIKNKRIHLNGEPIYLKQALYQGYWPDGLWTAPSDDAIKKDLLMVLEMGFNSIRIHQKVEDPRLLFWADQLGILLWGEMANAWANNTRAQQNLLSEWHDVVRRDRNHPSIITWVPCNESWGTGDLKLKNNQEWLKSLYHLTKSLDPTRPVVDNDGWEHVLTDICTIHDYSLPKIFATHYPLNEPENLGEFLSGLKIHKIIFAEGCKSRAEPVMITEWGGWGLYIDDVNIKPDPKVAWGYQGVLYKSFDEIVDLYAKTIEELMKRKKWITGHCYTEFCDYFQEVNGLLTFDRRPKGDISKIKKLNELL
ncbi:MAG: glycoside hydrolase family 2 protein [Promethearchaeota archaeon]